MDKVLSERYLEIFKNKTINEHTITSILGYGKSAVVFLATNKNGDSVAIKIFDNEIIKKYGDEVEKARIENELKLINHKINNLINILGGGRTTIGSNNYYYIIMDYIKGITLKEYIEKLGAQDVEMIKYTFDTLFSVTEELLKRNIVHRDIKPENIIINENKELILMDLGVMKIIDDPMITDILGEKPFIGTLRYASPEYLFREEINDVESWRSNNIYQIGAVLHDLIMGYEIFKQYSEPFSQLVLAIRDENPIIQRIDVSVKICSFVSNMLIKKYKTRLEIFKSTDLKTVFEKSSDSFDSIISEIINSNQDNIRGLEQLKNKQKEEDLKQIKILEKLMAIKDIIDKFMIFIHDKSLITNYDIISNNTYIKDIMVIKIIGEYKNGFCWPVYIFYNIYIQDDNIIKITNVGLIKVNDYPKNNYSVNQMQLILEDFKHKQGDNEIYHGVFDEKVILENIRLNIAKLIKEAVEFMKPWIKEDIEWEKQIVGKAGVFARMMPGRNDKFIDYLSKENPG